MSGFTKSPKTKADQNDSILSKIGRYLPGFFVCNVDGMTLFDWGAGGGAVGGGGGAGAGAGTVGDESPLIIFGSDSELGFSGACVTV